MSVKKSYVVRSMFMFLMVQGMIACSSLNTGDYSSSDRQQYLKSRNGTPLVVSPPLTAVNLSDFYNLPGQNQPARISISPPKR